MPRGPRLDAEGTLHYVMVRGIEERGIFLSDDRDDPLARAGVHVPRGSQMELSVGSVLGVRGF